ncbi:flagellar brake protein [Mesobacillus harenae]|uniref:flagellar brake protein n=1 Tax=Mesobacillus harenae TaxID=2213203 RepID=UPI0015802948|nr:flagellar brake domain-containing protein [Mesobacillus harenae]
MIKIGDTIILEPKHSSSEKEKYKCKLLERNESSLFIGYPVDLSSNRTVYLLEGTPLTATFSLADGTQFHFETEVKGRIKQAIPLIHLSYPGKEHTIKIQRRQYVRVETSVDVAVHAEDVSFPPFTTVTDDISAGGAALLIGKNINLKPGMIIDCWFVLPMQNGEFHYRLLKSKVIRSIDANQIKNKVSLQFIAATGTDRQLLLRFCFERQLAAKKRGLSV